MDDDASAWFIGGRSSFVRYWLCRTDTLEMPLETGSFGVDALLSSMPFAVRTVGPVDWTPQTHRLAPAWSALT